MKGHCCEDKEWLVCQLAPVGGEALIYSEGTRKLTGTENATSSGQLDSSMTTSRVVVCVDSTVESGAPAGRRRWPSTSGKSETVTPSPSPGDVLEPCLECAASSTNFAQHRLREHLSAIPMTQNDDRSCNVNGVAMLANKSPSVLRQTLPYYF